MREYLLSDVHPLGRSKAAFFESLGYSRLDWRQLAADLRRHARENDVTTTLETAYGRKHEVRGTLSGPRGSVLLVSIWIVRPGEDHPRFVTAYPATRQ